MIEVSAGKRTFVRVDEVDNRLRGVRDYVKRKLKGLKTWSWILEASIDSKIVMSKIAKYKRKNIDTINSLKSRYGITQMTEDQLKFMLDDVNKQIELHQSRLDGINKILTNK